MTDGQRIDFLAELMNLSVLKEMGAALTTDQRQMLDALSMEIFRCYKLHRREHDTPTAFRLAVEDAAKGGPHAKR